MTNDKQRERLVELIGKKLCASTDELEAVAEHLITNGVIVPPFDVGDTLYDISEFVEGIPCPEEYTLESDYISIRKDENGEYFFEYDCIDIYPNEIGRTIFLTKEEAEEALKGGAE